MPSVGTSRPGRPSSRSIPISRFEVMLRILDLCGGSGAWSQPYAEAGYDVELVDICNGHDVRLWRASRRPVHGILAAPPCTTFCRMRMCRGAPTEAAFLEALTVVDACLRIVAICRPVWWALENPVGYLRRWLGEPTLMFDPCDYGDPWTKRTWIWGHFTPPRFTRVPTDGPWIHRKKGRRGVNQNRSEIAKTPSGFARAFFAVNQ